MTIAVSPPRSSGDRNSWFKEGDIIGRVMLVATLDSVVLKYVERSNLKEIEDAASVRSVKSLR